MGMTTFYEAAPVHRVRQSHDSQLLTIQPLTLPSQPFNGKHLRDGMDKTIHTAEYRILLDLLRQARRKAGITQIDLALRIKETQSQVSKYERGEVRLDVIELRSICLALGITLPAFVAKLERCLSRRDNEDEEQ